MNWLDSVILGVVEGFSEFLPISSTGHMILAGRMLGIASNEFVKTFEIMIQLGAILAVIVYGRSWLNNIKIWQRVLAAFIPTGCIGFAGYHFIKKYLMSDPRIVIWALLTGGIILILFELFHRESLEAHEDLEQIPIYKAVLIGVIQAIAIIPGVSRSAATILGGLFLGIQRKTIVEFSFLLAIPTMLAAAGWDFIKSSHSFNSREFLLLAGGFITAFFVALASIHFLLRYIKSHNFIVFGIYRIILAVVMLIMGVGG